MSSYHTKLFFWEEWKKVHLPEDERNISYEDYQSQYGLDQKYWNWVKKQKRKHKRVFLMPTMGNSRIITKQALLSNPCACLHIVLAEEYAKLRQRENRAARRGLSGLQFHNEHFANREEENNEDTQRFEENEADEGNALNGVHGDEFYEENDNLNTYLDTDKTEDDWCVVAPDEAEDIAAGMTFESLDTETVDTEETEQFEEVAAETEDPQTYGLEHIQPNENAPVCHENMESNEESQEWRMENGEFQENPPENEEIHLNPMESGGFQQDPMENKEPQEDIVENGECQENSVEFNISNKKPFEGVINNMNYYDPYKPSRRFNEEDEMLANFRTNVLCHILVFVRNNREKEVFFDKHLSAMERAEVRRVIKFVLMGYEAPGLDYDHVDQIELVNFIHRNYSLSLGTRVVGTPPLCFLKLYKTSPDNVYLITPEYLDFNDEAKDNTANNTDQSGTNSSNKKNKNIMKIEIEELEEFGYLCVNEADEQFVRYKKIKSILSLCFMEFCQYSLYTELRTLGDFGMMETDAIQEVMYNIHACIQNPELCEELFDDDVDRAVFMNDKYMLEVKEDFNQESYVLKRRRSYH